MPNDFNRAGVEATIRLIVEAFRDAPNPSVAIAVEEILRTVDDALADALAEERALAQQAADNFDMMVEKLGEAERDLARVLGRGRVVHILRAGRPLCYFSALAPVGVPAHWPEGHSWVAIDDPARHVLATCPRCRALAMADEAHSPIRRAGNDTRPTDPL